jgi:hypothetical protein
VTFLRQIPACAALLLATHAFVAAPATPPLPPHAPEVTPPLIVDARLIDATATPTPEQIRPYERALIVHTYHVERVLTGSLADPEISVAHWAIRKKLPLPIPNRMDGLYRLHLNPFPDRPELQNEKIVDTTERFDLLLYFAPDWRTHPPSTRPVANEMPRQAPFRD